MATELVKVMNRSGGKVTYRIPDRGIRRELMPGQTIRVSKDEVEALSYTGGGLDLIRNYLLVDDSETLEELNVHTEPEYYMDAKQVVQLLQTGSLDQFLDTLDFAPDGVLDMIKDLAVELPLNDVAKRDALKNHKRTQFDVEEAIKSQRPDKEDAVATEEPKPQRRVAAKTPTRRVAAKTTTTK